MAIEIKEEMMRCADCGYTLTREQFSDFCYADSITKAQYHGMMEDGKCPECYKDGLEDYVPEKLPPCPVELALAITRYVDGVCNEAPHDIGLRIGELIAPYISDIRRETIEECVKTAAEFSTKKDKSIHPDIAWEDMNETAQMVAHTTAQQIAIEISTLAEESCAS